MNTADAIKHTVDFAIVSPSGEKYLANAYANLHGSLARGQFNRLRAIEIFTFAIDNAVWASLSGSPVCRQIHADYKASKLGPETATRLADKFIADNNATDQRPPRKWLRPLFGT